MPSFPQERQLAGVLSAQAGLCLLLAECNLSIWIWLRFRSSEFFYRPSPCPGALGSPLGPLCPDPKTVPIASFELGGNESRYDQKSLLLQANARSQVKLHHQAFWGIFTELSKIPGFFCCGRGAVIVK